MSISTDIATWVSSISTVTGNIGSFAVCPYSKTAVYEIVVLDNTEFVPPNTDFELIIYVLPTTIKYNELVQLADQYNTLYPHLIFLPDHKDRNTFINTVQTNNGKHNLLLCQSRAKLTDARQRLKNTDYYSYWNQDYLQEILTT